VEQKREGRDWADRGNVHLPARFFTPFQGQVFCSNFHHLLQSDL